ncbi:hypothetical protein Misp04_42530 [Micromonospora sp. NBRC 101691]|nr:hypothetical protein Misp04_42530 [Micromonospora sp. NBRC 101691]
METPARRATSAMVGRFTGASLHFPVALAGGSLRALGLIMPGRPPAHPRYCTRWASGGSDGTCPVKRHPFPAVSRSPRQE